MQNRLKRYSVFTWTADFFKQVYALKKEQERLHVKYLDDDSINNILTTYHDSLNRLFLLDYDGTLTPITDSPEKATLSKETKRIIKKIVRDKRNTVVIISGRDREFIGDQFKDLDVILVAEHGFFVRYHGDEWKNSLDVDLEWKERIMPVLNDYVDRCKGSMIEEKHASLAWHYRNADEEVATLRIHELKDDLEEVLKGESRLQILDGDKVLEIKSYLYDKGSITSSIVNNGNFDFIIAIGDDRTDEDLFKVIPEYGFTIKVGCKPTNARFNIVNQTRIAEILEQFAGA
jgi:trehalose 6-phosphate synthase/phosphatase